MKLIKSDPSNPLMTMEMRLNEANVKQILTSVMQEFFQAEATLHQKSSNSSSDEKIKPNNDSNITFVDMIVQSFRKVIQPDLDSLKKKLSASNLSKEFVQGVLEASGENIQPLLKALIQEIFYTQQLSDEEKHDLKQAPIKQIVNGLYKAMQPSMENFLGVEQGNSHAVNIAKKFTYGALCAIAQYLAGMLDPKHTQPLTPEVLGIKFQELRKYLTNKIPSLMKQVGKEVTTGVAENAKPFVDNVGHMLQQVARDFRKPQTLANTGTMVRYTTSNVLHDAFSSYYVKFGFFSISVKKKTASPEKIRQSIADESVRYAKAGGLNRLHGPEYKRVFKTPRDAAEKEIFKNRKKVKKYIKSSLKSYFVGNLNSIDQLLLAKNLGSSIALFVKEYKGSRRKHYIIGLNRQDLKEERFLSEAITSTLASYFSSQVEGKCFNETNSIMTDKRSSQGSSSSYDQNAMSDKGLGENASQPNNGTGDEIEINLNANH